MIDDVRRCITMDLKADNDALMLIEPKAGVAATPAERGGAASSARPRYFQRGVFACHDCSEGGLLVALAEMCIGSGKGAILLNDLNEDTLFIESPARYLVEISPGERDRERFELILGEAAQ